MVADCCIEDSFFSQEPSNQARQETDETFMWLGRAFQAVFVA
jgi:hypothetical protein